MLRHRSVLHFASSTLAVASAATSITAHAQSADAEGTGQPTAEIIVTAQKRAERIIDVPVSVNAVSSEQLDRQRVYSLGDLSRSVPSVSSNGAIRGLSTNGVTRSSAAAVAVILDGVELGSPVVGVPQITNLFDVERIEVLSGPQATLFGTTATAGVINVVSKAPNPDKYEVIGRVEVAENGFNREQLTVNVPLASNAAIRVSGHNDENHGLIRNTTLNDQLPTSYNRGVRGRLKWEPTSNLTVNLIGEYERLGGNGLRDVAYAIAPKGSGLEARLAKCGIVASIDNRRNCSKGNNGIVSRVEKYGFSGQVDLALGDHTLTSITSYRRSKLGDLDYNGPGGDSDFLSDNILDTNLTAEDLRITSQEIRLTSPSNQALEYVLGLFYFDKKQKDSVIQAGQLGDLGSLIALLSGLPQGTVFGRVNKLDIRNRTYAAFGQATYHVTDELSLIAGARYTDDTLTDVSTAATPATNPTLASYGYAFTPLFYIAPVNQKVSVHNFAWKLGAQYEFSRNMMTYFTATRGYKGPAANDQSSPPIAIPIIRPEIPMAYELGFKGSFLDNRVFMTLALFHTKVMNFQTSVYVPPSTSNPSGSFAQGNAPYVKTRGIDFSITARPTDELTVTGGVLYNRATYAPTFLVACNSAQVKGQGGCSAAGLTTPVSQLAGVPKWRLLLNGEYAKEVAPGLTIFTQADVTYESKQFAGTTPDPMLDVSGKTMLNARIGVRSPDRRWAVSAFGTNLLNTNYTRLTTDVLSGFNGGGGKSYWVAPGRGAAYGATVDFSF